MDWVLFLENSRAVEGLSLKMIQSLVSTLPGHLATIEKAIQEGIPQNLEFSAHALKSALANFYARPASTLADKLERIGREKSTTGAEIPFRELCLEIERLLNELQKLSER